jgi:hypothetical protein
VAPSDPSPRSSGRVTDVDDAGPGPVPSDRVPGVLDAGRGDVGAAVVSMSRRAADGNDAAYLRWHLFDHLPEQYRLVGVRNGTRWFSTRACREARAASDEPFDAVDHVVTYLFGAPDDAGLRVGLDRFFDLGKTLHDAGRMPLALPRVQVGGWRADERAAALRVMVGADVIPWRPHLGAYLLVEEEPADGGDHPTSSTGPAGLADLVAVEGVAGAWTFTDAHDLHRRFDPNPGRRLSILYLDDDPVTVAGRLEDPLRRRWAAGGALPLLAGPFASVDPWSIRRLDGSPAG